jgi:hypothetical protein
MQMDVQCGWSIVFGFQPTIWMINATNLTTAEPEELVTNDILKNPVQTFGLNGVMVDWFVSTLKQRWMFTMYSFWARRKQSLDLPDPMVCCLQQ